MRTWTPCNQPFFIMGNRTFECQVTDEVTNKGFYQFPYINVAVGDVPKAALNLWRHYREPLFVHEMCHVFRNHLNLDYGLLTTIDHGLTFKTYVALDDLLTEIEVLTLQEFILRQTNNTMWSDGELYAAIDRFHHNVPLADHFTDECKQKAIKESESRWANLGIDFLEHEFKKMLRNLDRDKPRTPIQILQE